MSAETKHRYSLEEYLALERESDERLEYWDGEVFAMSGGTLAHERTIGNTFNLLNRQLADNRCQVLGSGMQIKVPSALPYRYGDGSVVCGEVEVERFNGNDLLLNPILIYEVLSPSTEAYDRGDKFTYYKSIPSLREYLLIAQHRPHITHFVKQDDGSWSYSEVNGLDGSVSFPSLGITLKLGEIYQNVEFESDSGPKALLSEVSEYHSVRYGENVLAREDQSLVK
jgi:Uma2 family endonuclease